MKTAKIPAPPVLEISYQGSGPLVLFVHGLGGERSSWFDQLEACASRFTAVSLDLRGYGGSADYIGELDFKADFSNDILRVLEYFRVKRAHLVGLSMGSRVARWTAVLHPGRIASLVLANTSPGFDHMSPSEGETFVSERSASLQEPGYTVERFAAKQIDAMLGSSPDPQAAGKALAGMTKLRTETYLKTLRASTAQDRGCRIEEITCPTLIVAGSEDRVYPPRLGEAMRSRIPDAEMRLIPGAGHLSNLEQPMAFNQLLLDFLQRQPALPEAVPPSSTH